MQRLNTLKKRSLYLIGALVALIASYVVGNAEYTVSIDSPTILPPTAYADIPSSGSGSGGDDCGDTGDGGCQ